MKTVNRLSQLLCLMAAVCVLGIVLFDRRLQGSAFGPAAYYYTDIPDWQSRFYAAGGPLINGSETLMWPALGLSLAAACLFVWLLLRLGKTKRPER